MNIWIAPMDAAMKTRTMLAHNTLIVRELIRGTDQPYALSYSLGLFGPAAAHCNLEWYGRAGGSVDGNVSRTVLHFATTWYPLTSAHALRDLDLTAIWLRIRSLEPAEQVELQNLLDAHFFFLAHPTLNTACTTRKHTKAFDMNISDKIPAEVLAKLEMNLASLEESLLAKDPMMPQHLRATHQLLISYPETVHLLEDSEIARIIDAAQLHTEISIVKAKEVKATRKKVSASDL